MWSYRVKSGAFSHLAHALAYSGDIDGARAAATAAILGGGFGEFMEGVANSQRKCPSSGWGIVDPDGARFGPTRQRRTRQ